MVMPEQPDDDEPIDEAEADAPADDEQYLFWGINPLYVAP